MMRIRDLVGAILIPVACLLAATAVVGQPAPEASSFLPNPWYRTGLQPHSAAIGDFNGDGLADVAVGRGDVENEISVLLGIGGGVLGTAQGWPAGEFPQSVESADFDGDGFDDIVAVNNASHDISVLLSAGDGTFLPEDRYAVGYWPTDVVVDDFDGDAVPDLAVANDGGRSVSVLLGRGTGTFVPATDVSIGRQIRSLASGDLDGDGDLDLVAAHHLDHEVTVVWGDAHGGFSIGPVHPTANRPRSVVVVDLDGDGTLDLATANEWGDNVSVLLGDGAGGFAPTTSPAVGDGPQWLRVADLENDGVPDLVVGNRQSIDFSILRGIGDGTFAPQLRIPAGEGPSRFAIVDIDGDGHEDLVAALPVDRGITTLFGDGFGSFRAFVPLAFGNRPVWVAAADFDGDTTIDLVTADEDADIVTVRLGLGGGAWGPANAYPTGDQPQYVAVDDFDGNEIPDLAVPNRGSDDVSVFLGVGDGTFAPGVRMSAGTGPVHIDTPDLNQDEIPDLVVANLVSSDLSIFLGHGDGSFFRELRHPVSHQPKQVIGGDFRGSLGHVDVAVVGSGAFQVLVLQGNGDGTFGSEQTYDAGGSTNWVTVADLNSDDRDDLAIANSGTNRYSILFGEGPSGFSPPLSTPDPIKSRSIAHGDFNGDGIVDLVIGDGLVVSIAVNTVSVLLGHGDGTFEPDVRFLVGDLPQKVNVADANGDGAPDVLVPASNVDRISLLFHEGLAVVAEAGARQIEECVSPAGAGVQFDGSGSTALESSPGTNDAIESFDWFEGYGTPDETLLATGEIAVVPLPLGNHDIVLRTTTVDAATDIDVVVHAVRDTQAPSLSVSASPEVLWPPNHRLVDVTASIVATDVCGIPAVELIDLLSDEPDDAPGPGDGSTTGDVRDVEPGTPDDAFRLRAERDEAGSGRTYTVQHRATDFAGNVSTADANVVVPHDQDGVSEPLTLELSPHGVHTELSWPAVDGATAYNVVRGDLAAITESAEAIDLGTVTCVEANSPDTAAQDSIDPPVGAAFYFLVESEDAAGRSGYGTVTAPLPRVPVGGDCPD